MVDSTVGIVDGVLAGAGRGLSAARQVEEIFWQSVGEVHGTRLCGGGDEPLYQPASEGGQLAVITYRADYVASAFHEVAHWCIAGRARRQQVDFGYWYAGDGRDASTQSQFLAVEAKPQAVESFFHEAWGSTFHPSFDNLSGASVDPAPFLAALAAAQQAYRVGGLPPRAACFAAALARAQSP